MLFKVRIAVVMNEHGQWAAYGNWETDDDTAAGEAAGHVSATTASATFYVEADLPVPLPVTVRGTARPALPESKKEVLPE